MIVQYAAPSPSGGLVIYRCALWSPARPLWTGHRGGRRSAATSAAASTRGEEIMLQNDLSCEATASVPSDREVRIPGLGDCSHRPSEDRRIVRPTLLLETQPDLPHLLRQAGLHFLIRLRASG